LFVVISGWEWYHCNILESPHPLKKWPRFLVDLLAVVGSLVFLLSSKVQMLWLAAACIIFFLYVFWDALSVQEFPGDYTPPTGSIWEVYWELGKNGRVAANLGWFFYFLILFIVTGALTWKFSAGGPLLTLICCAWIVLGVAGLHFDAGTLTLSQRAVGGSALLVLYAVLTCDFPFARLDPPVAQWLDSVEPKPAVQQKRPT